MTVANKPSGSFVLWQNTLCNPLADPMVMTHSAWHDGYASAKAERKPLTEDQIVDIWAAVSMGYDDEINIIELARAIERAHGIGEQT